MTAPFRREPGGPRPLFDRLVDAAPHLSKETYPEAVLDPAAIVASVQREILRLLETRRPVGLQRPDLPPIPSVRDYGIPDMADLSPLDRDGRVAMEAALRRAIAAFEPRLADVGVTLALRDPDRDRRLDAVIAGTVRVGRVEQRVSFSVALAGRLAAS